MGLETGTRPHDLKIGTARTGIAGRTLGDTLAVNFWNTALPMLGLGGVAVALPNLLARKGNLSQPALFRAILASALLTLIAGALLAALLYARINPGVTAQFLAAPVERSGFFLGRSTLFAMFWGPVLGFVWLVKAQEVNRRLGLKMVDGEVK